LRWFASTDTGRDLQLALTPQSLDLAQLPVEPATNSPGGAARPRAQCTPTAVIVGDRLRCDEFCSRVHHSALL
jgi:hypothetical protein